MLVLAGAGAGALDPLGTRSGSRRRSSTRLHPHSAGVAARVGPSLLSALVCTGAAVTLTVASAVAGDLHPGAVTATGWGWLAGLAVVSTVGRRQPLLRRPEARRPDERLDPVDRRAGATVVLAFLVFGESLGPVQLAGGALVLGAVLVLERRRSAGVARARAADAVS